MLLGSVGLLLVLGLIGELLAPRPGWEAERYDLRPLADRATVPPDPRDAGEELRRYEITREEVTVPVPGDELAATVFTPRGEGPFPAVAFVHGAGVGEREPQFGLAERFARAGVVAVAYDKRSDYEYLGDRDFDRLAGDAVEVVRMMQERREVDDSRAGLWGLSEGGRVAPRAAQMSQDVGFVVSVSGAVRGPLRNTIWSVTEGLDAQGAPTGLARASAQLLAGGTMFTLHEDPPPEVWREVTQPVLIIYGTEDFLVPPAESSATIVSELEIGGNDRYAVRFFGDADHGLRSTAGYTRTMTDWVTGLPDSADGGPTVAGQLPVQHFATTAVPDTPWYGGAASLVFLVVVALVGALLVPLLLRPRIPRTVRAAPAVRRLRRAVRLSVLAFATWWLVVLAGIALGYTRLGAGWMHQAGWAGTRLLAVIAVIAAVAAAVGWRADVPAGMADSVAARTVTWSRVLVIVLMLVALAYWGAFALRW